MRAREFGNGIVLKATNAGAESVNSKIQKIKHMAYGFRNRDRFRTAFYLHLDGLDLAPATHMNFLKPPFLI